MLTLQELSFLENSRILITGGTGSLGKTLTRMVLDGTVNTTIIIYSRDEFKQYEMQQSYSSRETERIRFFLGDVRDKDRLYRAMKGVDYVIHAAALKQVPAAEYNPFEFVKTNIMGSQNLICAAIDRKVKRVVALSTDKAAEPINFYGATKLCADKLFVAANSYSGESQTIMSVVRYGNVVGSRGSVVPFFLEQRHKGYFPITDKRMTRFWITLQQGASLVLNALREMQGQEIFVPRIPSMKITDLATTIDPACEQREVGVRPGEKIHETMIPRDAGHRAYRFDSHYILLPDYVSKADDFYRAKGARTMPRFYAYSSDQNDAWLDGESLGRLIEGLDTPEARQWAERRKLDAIAHEEALSLASLGT